MCIDHFDEKQYEQMPESARVRRAQIPISAKRFRYLTEEYAPDAEDAYVMFQHPGHFVIYDQASKTCLFDMSCLPLSKEEKTRGDMELVVVIPEFRINPDLLQDPHVNAVGLASDLLLKEL